MKRTKGPRSLRGAPRAGDRADPSRKASSWTFLAGSIGWSTSNSSGRADGLCFLTGHRISRPCHLSGRACHRMFRLSRRGAHPPIEVSGPRGSMAGSPTRTTGRRTLSRRSAIEVTGRAIEVTDPPQEPSGAPTRPSGSATLVTDRRGSMTVSPVEMPAMPTRWPARNMIGTARELLSESLPSKSSSRKLRWQDVSHVFPRTCAPGGVPRTGCGLGSLLTRSASAAPPPTSALLRRASRRSPRAAAR